MQHCQTCDFLEGKDPAVVIFDEAFGLMEDDNGELTGDYAGLEDRFDEIDANNVLTYEDEYLGEEGALYGYHGG